MIELNLGFLNEGGTQFLLFLFQYVNILTHESV